MRDQAFMRRTNREDWWYVIVDGKTYGAWRSAAEAAGGLAVERERARKRKEKERAA